MIINIQHHTYTLDKDPYESDDVFYTRCWFITSQQPVHKIAFKKYLEYSYIYVNIKFHHVTYDTVIMKNIETYTNHLHKELTI